MDQGPRTWKNYFWSGTLFVCCALPGLYLFMVYALLLTVQVLDPKGEVSPLLLSAVKIDVGLVLMLTGVGMWKHWKYLLFFLCLPHALALYCLAGGDGGKAVITALIVAAVALIVSYFVRSSRRNREKLSETTALSGNLH